MTPWTAIISRVSPSNDALSPENSSKADDGATVVGRIVGTCDDEGDDEGDVEGDGDGTTNPPSIVGTGVGLSVSS